MRFSGQALISFIISSLISILSFSQDTTNMGTEFWVGYGHHQYMEPSPGCGCPASNTQQMLLYFSTSNQPATITLTIDSSNTNIATWWRRVYNVPANTVVSIENYPATTYTTSAGAVGTIPKGETGTYDARLYSAATNSSGLFRKKGIHIESDVPIAVHAHIYGAVASGATMVLPVKAWGYTYYSINSKQTDADRAYSWLFVIAKEDNTQVEITPSVQTLAENLTGLKQGVPKIINLQKGQIYQIMGYGDGFANGLELTGTKVRALVQGKPVAVFAGSSRTSNLASCGSGGRDNDIVQLFPIHVWGRKYLTAPTVYSNAASTSSINLYKIAVYDPTTVVKRNGVILSGLVNQRYYQFESNTPEYIEADKPVMVAQFMLGGACNGPYGDPDMYYLTPLDGGVKKVNCMRTTKETITINDLLLIVPTAGMPSLRIDSSASFDHSYSHPRLPGYTVVIKRWPASLSKFTVECDSAFTGITYGMAPAESYGFNIGRKFIPLHGIDPMYRVTWTGLIDNDWRNGANWSTGLMPTTDDNIFIPAGTLNNLIIDEGLAVGCQSLELGAVAVITVKPSATLNVKN